MNGRSAKTLDNEIVRACSPYFNHVEPSVFATVTRVHATTADISLAVGEDIIPFGNVPVLKPCYSSFESLNLTIGDKVLLIFQEGSITAPIVVGKL